MAEQYGDDRKIVTGYAFHRGTAVEYWGFPGLAPGAGLEDNVGVA